MADTIRETIRTTRVYASPSLKSEYGPELWADKRKQAFGRVRLVNDSSALPLDTFHAELCEMDPASFDDGLICLSDMLDEMIDYMTRSAKDDSDAAEFAYRLDRMTAERDALRKEVEELRNTVELLHIKDLSTAQNNIELSSELAAAHNELNDLRKAIWKGADEAQKADLQQLRDQIINLRRDRENAWKASGATVNDINLFGRSIPWHDSQPSGEFTSDRKEVETPSAAPEASKPTADKFTAIRNQFASVPGVKIEVHGEQSSDPILWIFGTTKAMREQLVAAGLRWAPKKSGWYTRVY